MDVISEGLGAPSEGLEVTFVGLDVPSDTLGALSDALGALSDALGAPSDTLGAPSDALGAILEPVRPLNLNPIASLRSVTAGIVPGPREPDTGSTSTRLTNGAQSAVQGTANSHARPIHDVGIDHGRGHIAVSQQFLHRADIVVRFEQVSRKAVPQGVATGGLGDSRASDRVRHRPLHRRFVQMMPTDRIAPLGGTGCRFGYLCADGTRGCHRRVICFNRTSSGFATPVGSEPPTGATLRHRPLPSASRTHARSSTSAHRANAPPSADDTSSQSFALQFPRVNPWPHSGPRLQLQPHPPSLPCLPSPLARIS